LRPRYTDVIVSQVPLVSVLLGAAARGVPSRISISRRMVTIVYQTDLTRLWSVPRRSRVVPLLAGIAVDAAIAGAGVLLELGGFAGPLVRALVFMNLSAILFQLQVYMRTDFYALFVVATGCRNLWAAKGAVARRLIRRATPQDSALLGTLGRREVAWAHVYLVLYVPGVVWTAWYFTVFGVPAIAKLAGMSLAALTTHGLFTPFGAAGAAALALTTASTGFIVLGLVRTAIRLTRQVMGHRGRVSAGRAGRLRRRGRHSSPRRTT
jgi:putative peptide zinc metalloprotease protein